MALLSLAMGAQAGLDDRAIEAGQILVTTDTARMYVDVSNTSRIELNANIAEKVKNALSVQVNGAAFKTFNGSAASTINFVAGKNITLTASGNNITIKSADIPTALPNPAALKWGNQTYTGAAEKTITLADFGLTNVLHFLGTTTTNIKQSPTTQTVAIGSGNVTAKSGDIVMYDGAEFIWASNTWEKLGDETAWVPLGREVNTTGILEGGGTLDNNLTIAHKQITVTKPNSTSGLFVKNIITDQWGHITQWENADCANLALQIAGTTKTTYDPFSGTAATFNVPIMTGADTTKAGATGLVPLPTQGASTRVLTAGGSWSALAAGTGISVSGLTITNSGVRSVVDHATNGKITVNTNGTSTDITVYSLPAATASALGGVKVGSNITVSSGTISLTGNNVRTAMGAATSTNSGYLSSTDFTTFTNAANAVVWGTF